MIRGRKPCYYNRIPACRVGVGPKMLYFLFDYLFRAALLNLFPSSNGRKSVQRNLYSALCGIPTSRITIWCTMPEVSLRRPPFNLIANAKSLRCDFMVKTCSKSTHTVFLRLSATKLNYSFQMSPLSSGIA